MQTPDASDFDSAVPIRFRVESVNSLNNRFRGDPLIRTEAVLSLDDDIFMTCADLGERGGHLRTRPAQCGVTQCSGGGLHVQNKGLHNGARHPLHW